MQTKLLYVVVGLLLVLVGLLAFALFKPPQDVPIVEMDAQCFTNTEQFTCTFTNTDPVPVKGCAFGVVSQKEGDSSVKSQTICTGTLESMESRTLSGMWVGSSPDDICSTYNELLKTDQMDWSKCSFEIKSAHVTR